MAASVEAIFLSTFVLISQNRMTAQADKQAELDVQIGLLTRHAVTRILTLIRAVAEKMRVEESKNPELNELANDVRPEKVLNHIEQNSGQATLD